MLLLLVHFRPESFTHRFEIRGTVPSPCTMTGSWVSTLSGRSREASSVLREADISQVQQKSSSHRAFRCWQYQMVRLSQIKFGKCLISQIKHQRAAIKLVLNSKSSLFSFKNFCKRIFFLWCLEEKNWQKKIENGNSRCKMIQDFSWSTKLVCVPSWAL
jgi:hypothetical protein